MSASRLCSLLLLIFTALLPVRSIAVGTWLHLGSSAPDSVGMTMLLSDGTVIAANNPTDTSGAIGNDWYKLTPDPQGHYVNGEWTRIASANFKRLFFGSLMMTNGNVLVVGGEYPAGGSTQASAEIYNPLLNTWTQVPPPLALLNPTQPSPDTPTNITQGFIDCETKLLPNGNVMIAPVAPSITKGTLIFNPAANTWSVGQQAVSTQKEQTWVELPDGSILTVDHDSTNSERYFPALNYWTNDANLPVNLWANLGPKYIGETGPAFLLPNGNVFFLGGAGKTAIYTPSGGTNNGTWAAGPDIPGGLVCADAPGAMMPNGKILFAAAPPPTLDVNNNPQFPHPTSFFEYDYSVGSIGTYTQVSGPTDVTDDIASYQSSMLVLPDGSILYNHFKQDDLFYSSFGNQLHIYVPDGVPVAAGKPIIQSITPNGDGTFHLLGYNLTGISEGACFGDDDQAHSNYPIIQFKDTNNAHVDYGRTFNWTATGVNTGLSSTEFSLPAGLIPQTYLVQVSANGILSDPVVFPFVSPTSLSLCPGDNATLSGFPSPNPATYQWLFNGQVIAGQTSLQLNFVNATTNQSGLYSLRVTSGGTSTTSLPVPVSVGVWTVTQPPATNSAAICTPKTLTVVARGKGTLTAKWIQNGALVVPDVRVTETTTALPTGATQFDLHFSEVHYVDDAFYKVQITDDCGAVTTPTFSLRTTPNPPWIVAATSGPPPRCFAAGAYDSTRHVTVLFGGEIFPPSGSPVLADTWEYNGTNWVQCFPATSPTPRAVAQMVYDSVRQRCVLFGGQVYSNTQLVANLETWEWDGNNWQQIVTPTVPHWTSPMQFAACYDSVRQETLIYGGSDQTGHLNQFWSYDGTDWHLKQPSGLKPFAPAVTMMTFDSTRGVAVLLGANTQLYPTVYNTQGAVWEWNGDVWNEKFQGNGQYYNGTPGIDNLTYDTVRHESILYGSVFGRIDGTNSSFLPYPDGYRYVWRWNGEEWQADTPTPTPGVSDFQLYATFCFDSARGAAVLFGGRGDSAVLITNTTFELVYQDDPAVLQQSLAQIALLGQTVQLSVLAAGAPVIAYQWQKGGTPLSDGGNISGTTTNTLNIHVTSPNDAGNYQLNMVNPCGVASSQPISLSVVAGQMVVGVSGGHPVITWNNPGAILQSSINVNGPWTTINGATSPYQVTSPAGAMFFRLIQ